MSTEIKSYSSFLPLMIVLVSFCLANIVDIYGVLKRRSLVNTQLQAIEERLPESRQARQTLVDLSNELLLLAPTSPTAREIVQGFQLRPTPPELQK